MKKVISMLLALVLIYTLATPAFAVLPPPDDVYTYGIYGNGTNEIYIDITSPSFSTTDLGNQAYTTVGCAWFAAARMTQLTGKKFTIWSGQNWFNNAESRGYRVVESVQAAQAGAFACFANHIAVVEQVDGDTVTISEGGWGKSNPNVFKKHGFCRIATMSISEVETYAGDFLGYVYITGGGAPPTPTSPLIFKDRYAENITQTSARVRAEVTKVGEMSQVGVNWGTTPDMLETPITDPSAVNFIYYDLNNLQPGTTYYYRFFVKDTLGNTFYDEMRSFTTEAPADAAPEGCVDGLWTSYNTINLSGWAFDWDNVGAILQINVYVDDQLTGTLTADKYRSDVNAAYPGAGEFHGFDGSVPTNCSGDHKITVYAIDANGDKHTLIYDQVVNIPADTDPPAISNVQVSNVTADGYDVSCTVADNVGIDRVQFPTWTPANGQDDIASSWWDNPAVRGTTSDGSTYTFHVDVADHNNESGDYITHIYAYDTSDNCSSYGIAVYIDRTPPVISNIQVSNLTSDGYDISCTVTDDVGVDRVQFPTWTLANGQDDLASSWWDNPAVRGTTSDGSTYTFHVDAADHNNETGDYMTHIYAYDAADNVSAYWTETGATAITVPAKHTHTLEFVEKTAATCVTGGNIEYYRCTDCGKIFADEEATQELESVETAINPNNHAGGVALRNAKAATCTEKGYTGDTYCLSCNVLIAAGAEIEMLPHTYGDWQSDENGHWHLCAVCGTRADEAAHTPDRDAPTETEAQLCTVCGAVIAPATGHMTHTPGDKWFTDGTSHWHQCVDCGAKLDVAVHTGGAATCQEQAICEVCGQSYGDLGGHSLTHKEAVAASCTAPGNVEYWHCETCGKNFANAEASAELTSISTALDPNNHTGETSLQNAKDATCTEQGYTGDTVCNSCGAVVQQGSEIPALGHSYRDGEVIKEPTCAEAGEKEMVCDRCGDRHTVALEPLPHTWDDGKVTTPATTSTEGVKTYTCTVCGATKTETIPKLTETEQPDKPDEGETPSEPSETPEGSQQTATPSGDTAAPQQVADPAGQTPASQPSAAPTPAPSIPQTSDNSQPMLVFWMMVISAAGLGGIAAVKRRRS